MRRLGFNNIRLLGKTVTIREVEAIPNAPQGAVGLNNCNTLEILLLDKQADDVKKDTLLHEIIHMIDYEYQLNMK